MIKTYIYTQMWTQGEFSAHTLTVESCESFHDNNKLAMKKIKKIAETGLTEKGTHKIWKTWCVFAVHVQ